MFMTHQTLFGPAFSFGHFPHLRTCVLSHLFQKVRALGGQPLVKLTELSQEAVVGADLPLVAHRGQGRVDVQTPPQHQEGDDQGGRAAVALPAVDVHLACILETSSKPKALNM